jgi:hypothetical protein
MDPALLGFRGPLQSAARRQPAFLGANELVQAQLSIGALTPFVKETFRAALDDLAKECAELQRAAMREKKMAAKLDLRGRAVAEQSAFFECERIRQEIESQTQSDLRQTVEEFRKVFENESDPFLEDEPEENGATAKIRAGIAALKRAGEASLQRYLGRIATLRRSLRDDIDEAASLRDLTRFSYQKFAHAVLAAPDGRQRVPRAMRFEAGEFEDPPASPLVDAVKRRLGEIQARREADLQSSASFLKSVLREERRRIRSEVSSH